jgi:hypothetical protein
MFAQQQRLEGVLLGKGRKQGPLLLAAMALVEVLLLFRKLRGLVVGVVAAVEVAMLLTLLMPLLVVDVLLVMLLQLAEGLLLR